MEERPLKFGLGFQGLHKGSEKELQAQCRVFWVEGEGGGVGGGGGIKHTISTKGLCEFVLLNNYKCTIVEPIPNCNSKS